MSEEIVLQKENPTEYTMSSDWGDAISWLNPEQFKKEWGQGDVFKVVGHKRNIPEEGDVLKAEFERSWIRFTFIKVERCGDPHDMFFADVQAFEQQMKEDA